MRPSNHRTLKQTAREMLLGNYRYFVFSFSFCILFSILLEEIITFAFPVSALSGGIFSAAPPFLCNLIAMILLEILSFGIIAQVYFLCQGNAVSMKDLFFGFLYHPERIAAYFLLRLGAFGILGVLPVFLAAFYLPFARLSVLLRILFVLLCLTALLWVLITYALFPFVYLDHPDQSALWLLRESRICMRGHLVSYFVLQVKFCGVFLLSLLSLGVGFLLVKPYLITSRALFYLDINSSAPSSPVK